MKRKRGIKKEGSLDNLIKKVNFVEERRRNTADEESSGLAVEGFLY